AADVARDLQSHQGVSGPAAAALRGEGDMGLREQPARFRLLFYAKAAAALAAAGWLWSVAPPTRWPLLAFLTLCGLVAGACKVDACVKGARITMGFTVTFFALLLLGTAAALLVGQLGML